MIDEVEIEKAGDDWRVEIKGEGIKTVAYSRNLRFAMRAAFNQWLKCKGDIK